MTINKLLLFTIFLVAIFQFFGQVVSFRLGCFFSGLKNFSFKKNILIVLIWFIFLGLFFLFLGFIIRIFIGEVGQAQEVWIVVTTSFFSLFVLHKILARVFNTAFRKNFWIFFHTWIFGIIFFTIISFFVRGFIIDGYQIGNDAMAPALVENDWVVVNHFNRSYEKDQIVFTNIDNTLSIYRIVGLPGELIKLNETDSVELIQGQFYVKFDNPKFHDVNQGEGLVVHKEDIIGSYWTHVTKGFIDFFSILVS